MDDLDGTSRALESHPGRPGRGLPAAPEPRGPFDGLRPAQCASNTRSAGVNADSSAPAEIDATAIPRRASGSRAAIATATPSASAIAIDGSDRSLGSSTRVRIGLPCFADDDGQVGRIDRPAAMAAPDPPRGLLGGDDAPEPVRPPIVGTAPGQVLGPLRPVELRRFQHVAPDGTPHVRRGRQPHRPGGRARFVRAATPRRGRPPAAGGRRRDTGPASGTASPPSRAAASRRVPSGRTISADDADAVPLDLLDGDPAGDVGADRWPIAVDRSSSMRSGKTTSPRSARWSSPQQPSRCVKLSMTIRSVCSFAGRPGPSNGSQGRTRKTPSIPCAEHSPTSTSAWSAGPWNSHCSP